MMEVVFFFKLNLQTQWSWQAWFSRKETKTRPWSSTDRSASPSWTCTQFPSHWIWVGKYIKTIASSPFEGILIIPCHCAGVFKIFCVVSKSPEKKVYQRCLSQAEAILPIRRYLAKSGDVSGYNIQGGALQASRRVGQVGKALNLHSKGNGIWLKMAACRWSISPELKKAHPEQALPVTGDRLPTAPYPIQGVPRPVPTTPLAYDCSGLHSYHSSSCFHYAQAMVSVN